MNRRKFLALSSTAMTAGTWPVVAVPAAREQRPGLSKEFLLGVEYYRAPMPPQEFWDQDFADIRRAGLRIVRTFSYWNWMEPQPGKYELDDFDRLFELAHKHDLLVWFDMTLATHGAAPEWMRRRHPDMRVVSSEGQVAVPRAGNAAPQGRQWHCYNHPKWREYGGAILRAVVDRYKDAPNLIMWSVWDGVATAAAHYGFPKGCYCEHSISAYRDWLKRRFSLDRLNRKLHRRYRDWADVEPARSDSAIVEMMLWQEFQNEDLRDQVRWQVEVVRSLDDRHEVRGHGAHFPRIWDELSAREFDSWGFSSRSNDFLSGDDPYHFAETCFATDWSRSIGTGGRWWYEEIYAGMNPGGMHHKRQTTPEEISANMWLALARGGSGALFWQYRPEYLSFEAPGLNLVSLGGVRLPRLAAAEKTIQQMKRVRPHLPLRIPRAEMAVVYHEKSDVLHRLGKAGTDYRASLRGTYRTLWEHNIPVDVVSPRMDWDGYKLVYLPRTAVLDEDLVEKVRRTVSGAGGPRLVADGPFGTNAENGRFSFDPPEGLSELLGVKTLDHSRITAKEIRDETNRLRLEGGEFPIGRECNFIGLQLAGQARPVAWHGDEVVGMQTSGRRFTWITLSLWEGLESPVRDEVLVPLVRSLGVDSPVRTEGDRIIVQLAQAREEGVLMFLFNLEPRAAETGLSPKWSFSRAQDLIDEHTVPVQDGRFRVQVPPGEVKVLHLS